MGKKQRLKMERAKEAAEQAARAPGVPAAPWAAMSVVLLGVGFIITSLVQMEKLSDYANYQYLFQEYSKETVQARYFFSWAVRWIGLAIGAGLIFRREFFRKAAIALAGGTLLAAYWKHPYEGFLRHIHALNEKMTGSAALFSPAHAVSAIRSSAGMTSFNESAFAWACVITIIATEVLIAFAVILFLTRPSVKAAFK